MAFICSNRPHIKIRKKYEQAKLKRILSELSLYKRVSAYSGTPLADDTSS